MLVVVPFFKGDRPLAVQWSDWVNKLGPYPSHDLMIIRDHRADQIDGMGASFRQVSELIISDDAYDKWPESPNLMIRKAGKHIEYGTKEPWLWCEVDAIPLKAGWLDLIEAEYRACGKPFLGDFVHVPELMDVPDHMSGVAVYPGALSHFAGDAYLAHEVAWDVQACKQIVPQMHKSKHILHRWKHAAFETWKQVQTTIFDVKPEASLFHADKAGSLIDLLRNQNLPVPVLAESAEGARNPALVKLQALGPEPDEARESTNLAKVAKTDSRGGQFICDILIKSYPKDYERLGYCLRSIEKFAAGFRKIVLVVPKPSDDEYSFGTGIIHADRIKVDRIEIVESGDGYLFQNAVKASAHDYTDADYVLHIDSDTILTQPVTPETFMRDGKPLWLITPYAELKRDIEQISMGNAGFTCGVMEWQRITEAFLGQPVEYEAMRRFPMLVPRWLHVAAAAFCAGKHGVTLTDYIMSRPAHEFSEFNALGALAYYHHRDKITWLDTTKEPLPEPVAIQKWSHDEFTDETKAEFEKILKGGQHDDRATTKYADSNEHDSGRSADSSGCHRVPEKIWEVNPNIRQTKEGIWILANDSHISKWVEEKGSLQHDYETLPQILSEIPVGGTVVDVGAFIGDTTAPFLERVGPTGKVLAFEPNGDAFNCLKRNLSKYSNAHLFPFALGAPNDPMLELAPEVNAGARYLRKFGWEKEQGCAVDIATLDSLNLAKCDCLKCDAEGFELHVLKGAEETINRFHPKLVLEINEAALARQGSSAEEISDWLFKHGYKWRPLQSDITAASPQYDILCTWIEPAVSDSTVNWSKFEKDARFTSPPTNDSREAILRDAVAVLKQLCTAPRFISQVRKELKAQGVTK